MKSTYKYFIGVDGGGSGTRVIVAGADMVPLAQAEGAPSALGQGIEKAWRSILDTIALAFANSFSAKSNEDFCNEILSLTNCF